MPLKPIKYGFKIFLLCENRTSYVLNYEPLISTKSKINVTFNSKNKHSFIHNLNLRMT